MVKLNHKYGLRTVAAVETIKGVAVLALCIVLLTLLHKDLDVVVDHLTELLRINPDSRVADWFYDLADRTTGRGIWTAVSVGIVYAAGRFVEGYGLWHQRSWAEWFAVISGAVYVPVEVYSVVVHPQWTRVAVLLINIVVVLYILRILLENRRERCCGACTEDSSKRDSGKTESSTGESRVNAGGEAHQPSPPGVS